jgi:hypothetical protein
MKRFNMTGTSAHHSVLQRTTNFLVTPFNRVVKALSTLTLFIMLMTLTSISSNAQCTGPNNCPPGGCGQWKWVNNTGCDIQLNAISAPCYNVLNIMIPAHTSTAILQIPCEQCDDGCHCADAVTFQVNGTTSISNFTVNPIGYDQSTDYANYPGTPWCESCPNGIRVIQHVAAGVTTITIDCY